MICVIAAQEHTPKAESKDFKNKTKYVSTLTKEMSKISLCHYLPNQNPDPTQMGKKKNKTNIILYKRFLDYMYIKKKI